MGNKGTIKIGTSGWSYSHWQDIFYPKNLTSLQKLAYYSKNFNTVEVNNTFYRFPKRKDCLNWKENSNKNFVFSLKVPRIITHIKRMKEINGYLSDFFKEIISLENKLGPILFQFPEAFKASEANFERIKKLPFIIKRLNVNIKIAFEFRDISWFNGQIYNFLRENNFSLVIADSSIYPKKEVITSNFIYIRMHGPQSIFSSQYKLSEIKEMAKKINNWSLSGLNIYCYFNNDANGYAVKNAKMLLFEVLGKK